MVPSINKLNKTLHKVKTDICMVPSINKLNKTMNKAKMIFKSEFPSNIYNSHSTLMKSYQQVGVSLTDLLFHRDDKLIVEVTSNKIVQGNPAINPRKK